MKKRVRRMERSKKRREKRKGQKREGVNELPSICICDIELRELQSYIVLLSIGNVYYTCYY